MEHIKNFQGLQVWQEAHQLVLSVYRMSGTFPAEERYGLTSQIRRAAVSVAANIAEGFKRKGKRDKMRFYNLSEASLEEVKYYLVLARDLNYAADTEPLTNQAESVSRMLYRLIESISKRSER